MQWIIELWSNKNQESRLHNEKFWVPAPLKKTFVLWSSWFPFWVVVSLVRSTIYYMAMNFEILIKSSKPWLKCKKIQEWIIDCRDTKWLRKWNENPQHLFQIQLFEVKKNQVISFKIEVMNTVWYYSIQLWNSFL